MRCDPNKFFRCENPSRTHEWFLWGLGLTALSVPVMLIGGKPVPVEPAARAALVPLMFPRGAGLGLRVDL